MAKQDFELSIQKANLFRFIPGAIPPKDGNLLRAGAKYSEEITNTELGIKAGVFIGPELMDNTGDDFVMSPGGVIVPAQATKVNGETKFIDVKSLGPKGAKDPNGKKKTFIFRGSFQEMDRSVFATAWNEEKEVNLEVWTGDCAELSELPYLQQRRAHALQLLQAGYFSHGTVAFSGGDVLIDATSKKRVSKGKGDIIEDPNIQGLRVASAKLLAERQGKAIAGIPIWTASTWRIKYSAKESESVLVRQHDRFWLVFVKEATKIVAKEVPEGAYKGRYERLKIAESKAQATVAA